MKYIRQYIKEPLIIVFSILMMLGNTPLYANNGGNYNPEAGYDYIALKDGTIIKGDIVKFASNSFKIITDEGKKRVRNKDVVIVGFSQELTQSETYQLGVLDGKRYAENKGGNMLLGFLFPLLGTVAVYLTSDQSPGYEAMAGPNKAIVNDINYLRGYEKGATAKSGGNALIGAVIAVAAIVLLTAAVVDEVDDYYY